MGINKNELDETDTSCLVVHGAASFIDRGPNARDCVVHYEI